MTNEIAKPIAAWSHGVQIRSLDEAFRFATAVYKSGLCPSLKSPEAVMVALQIGSELGLSPMRAINSVAVINGRPMLYGDAPLAICMERGEIKSIHEWISGEGDDMTAHCRVTLPDGQTKETEFSVADAKTAQLWTKPGPWQQYPKRMLKFRARGYCLRDAAPGPLCGVRMDADDEPAMCDVTPAEPQRTIIEPDDEFAPPIQDAQFDRQGGPNPHPHVPGAESNGDHGEEAVCDEQQSLQPPPSALLTLVDGETVPPSPANLKQWIEGWRDSIESATTLADKEHLDNIFGAPLRDALTIYADAPRAIRAIKALQSMLDIM